MVPDLRRMGVLSGLAAPVTFFVLYAIAAFGDPEYVFFESYLSDLGVGRMAGFFNAAAIIAGALTIPFALLAIRPALDGGVVATAAVVLTVIGGTFLILVGVFTEDYEGIHYPVSVGFFMSMLLALLCYSWNLHFSNALGRPVTELTKLTFALGLVLVVLGGFSPQTETVAVMAIIVWGLAVAMTLFRSGAGADTY
jgi:hypothetical membrane protein